MQPHQTRPLLAIVGRPNVGKSTLFNRLVGGRPALVHDTPGLTRDRRYGEFEYFGHHFRVVDTGGLDPAAERDVIGAGIHRQASEAIAECDAVLFVVDAVSGLAPLDHEVAAMVRRTGVPVLCAANKVDHRKREVLAHEVHELGLGDVFPISAVHGRGIDELIEAVVARLALPPPVPEVDDDDDDAYARGGRRGRKRRGGGPNAGPYGDSDGDGDRDADSDGDGDSDADADADSDGHDRPVRVALVGKPNAGKSSLLNRLVGVERALVHHEPGTTTDPVDTELTLGDRSYVLVDTAGIRRKARVEADTEKIAVTMALAQIRRADVVVLMIDGARGPSEQDARLAGAIEEAGRAVVIALNKADLLDGPGAGRALQQQTSDELHFLPYAPVVIISALRGDGVGELMATVDRVAAQHRRRITTAELNRFFIDVVEAVPPPLYRGRSVRIHYLTQGRSRPPTFLLWANRPGGVSPAYRRFLANQLRATYGFEGTPLRVKVLAKRTNRKR